MKDEKACCKATINVILFAKHVSNHDIKGKKSTCLTGYPHTCLNGSVICWLSLSKESNKKCYWLSSSNNNDNNMSSKCSIVSYAQMS